MLEFLRRAVRFAQQAQSVIEEVSDQIEEAKGEPSEKENGSDVAEAPSKSEAEASAPASYRAMLEAGARDGRDLLSRSEAEAILGKAVGEAILTGQEEYLMCEYFARDGSGSHHHLGVNVSATMPWDYFETEVRQDEPIPDLGDAAFRCDDSIFVKAGDTVFWITYRGEATREQGLEAVRRVLANLGE